MSTPHVLLLQVGLLLLWAGLLRFGRSLPRARRLALQAALAGVALLAHVDYPHFHGRDERVQYYDFFHYYVGTKYHAEVGYTGLYEAATLADALDAPAVLRLSPEIRALDDYLYEHKDAVLARRSAILSRFSPERWREFRADVAFFRARDPQSWAVGVLRDHGYNGPPLLTALLGTLASQPWLSTPSFVRFGSLLDGILLLATAVAIGRGLGLETALAFAFFFGANPLNDYFTIGGGYLRYLHLCATALAVVALRRGRFLTAGGLLAVAVHLRGVALLLALAVGLQLLLARDRAWRLRTRRGFLIGFVALGLGLFGATLGLRQPGGENVWSAFRTKIALHAENLGLNCIGLRYPFMYSEEANSAAVRRSWPDGARLNWIAEARATLERRRVGYGVSVVLLLALSLLVLRRTSTESGALIAGPLWAYTGMMLAHYDYALLALVPLMYTRGSRAERALALGLALVAGASFVPGAAELVDLRFALASVAVGGTLVAVALLGLGQASAEDSASARPSAGAT